MIRFTVSTSVGWSTNTSGFAVLSGRCSTRAAPAVDRHVGRGGERPQQVDLRRGVHDQRALVHIAQLGRPSLAGAEVQRLCVTAGRVRERSVAVGRGSRRAPPSRRQGTVCRGACPGRSGPRLPGRRPPIHVCAPALQSGQGRAPRMRMPTRQYPKGRLDDEVALRHAQTTPATLHCSFLSARQ